MAALRTADAAAGLGQPPAQGADDRRRLQDPPERVRRRLDLEDPLPRGPEAAQPAPHLGRLPPLQPVRRRAAADDPAPAARRVPAAAGDPPGAGRRRRPRPRRRRAQAGQRRRAAGDPGRHLARLPDPRRGGRGDRRPRGADRRARELRHRPARETRGQDRLRRDRPRDRPRRQRALAGRRRRPQPARLPLLGRPRGAACWKRCWARRCARATRSAARRRCRAWKAWRRRSATSSTCCWSGTCAAWPATDAPRAADAAGNPPPHDRGPGRARSGSLVSDPYSLPRWWPRTGRVENVEQRGGGRRSQWTKVLETSEGRGVRADFRCVSSAENERYVWEQQLEGTPFARHLRSSRIEIALRESGDGDPGRPQPRCRP